MAEELMRIELDYTYTYDQFTVFFYGNRVFVGKKDYPVGQCCVDVMNLDESILGEIDRCVRLFIPAARKLPREKTDSAAALAQERLNAVWELIFALPVYRDLKMDEACCFHTFQRLMADREKWAQVRDPSSEGYAIYQGMMAGLACFAESIRTFRKQITEMTRKYFEPLKRRTNGAYAEAYSRFYADMLSIGTHIFNDEFEQSFPMEVSFVPMMHPTEEGRFFVAEDLEASWVPSYGPEMRGGTANCTVIISDERIGAPLVESPSEVIAMNRAALNKFESRVAPGGTVFVNSSIIPDKVSREDVSAVYVPCDEIAAELGNSKVANMVMLGAYVAATGALKQETIETMIAEMFTGKKAKLVPLNLEALKRGMECGKPA